ncbi:MAG: hypothetical protein AABZ33_13220 [Chloroflexota bacterium]
MTVNQVLCPDCGRPPGIGRDTCAACGASLDPITRAAAAASQAPGRASLLADLPFDAPNDAAGWLVAIGGLVATVGFLLPWAPNVIGSAGIGGYVDRWGLATISHLPVFLAVLIVALLALIPSRVPTWLMSGLVPILLGGLLVGLAWPYLVGGLGTGIGLLADAVAAVALVVGGSLRLAPWRHGSEKAPVL